MTSAEWISDVDLSSLGTEAVRPPFFRRQQHAAAPSYPLAIPIANNKEGRPLGRVANRKSVSVDDFLIAIWCSIEACLKSKLIRTWYFVV